MILYFLVCHLFALLSAKEVPYPKIIHHTNPQAKCLDGSSPALYVHQGNEPEKILIFIQGGGFCAGLTQGQTIEDCYQRSKTYLGSSTLWPDELVAGGYLSTDPSKSRFAEWTKIMLAYCDGSFHQGYREMPIPYKNTNLFFRGKLIMKAQLAYIQQNFHLSEAKKVIWTGSSAGAVASLIWMQTARSMVKNKAQFYTIPDSGVFLDFPTHTFKAHEFMDQVKTLYRISNLDSETPLELCNIYLSDQPWKCLFVQYNYHYLYGKMLFIQSQYDSVVINNILKIPCGQNKTEGGQTLFFCDEKQMKYIQEYRYAYQKLMITMAQASDDFSYWDISCSNHVYACLDSFYDSSLNRVPETTGMTVRKAVEGFVLNGQKRIIATDKFSYPENYACS